ncbi:LLM class F420-dependent oxidoreductase [Yinghuangia soli]|uniref:LLM class F420-dependent oxidoreductase n=1 Tax=Yinghuangia soli TaxID=2908204 RepID=A0AA41PZ73_9ACTN|nr:LLM class F420-dependent oxidoreductase [Yinghuangia soli]MCF2528035.1 LLM class F420-dependent oxidoreductase [Yinghuangia soli]
MTATPDSEVGADTARAVPGGAPGAKLSVSLGLWQDRPPGEALATAEAADRLGYDELWIGEMATYDAFALAVAAAARTTRIPLTIGPLAVTVRDPATIAMGAASVADFTGRPVGVALGTSSTVVVEDWHGRSRARAARALDESAGAVRTLLAGGRADLDGEVLRCRGFRLRLPAVPGPLTIAAFGPAALRTAARHADRLVLNLVSPETAADLIADLEKAARQVGRPRPAVAVWVCAALEGAAAQPAPDTGAGDVPPGVEQLRRGLVPYLAAPGYADMFTRAGFGEVVAYARTAPHPRDLLAAVPRELVDVVAVTADPAARVAEYTAAGVDEFVVVPAATEADPGGTRTLTELRTAVRPPA